MIRNGIATLACAGLFSGALGLAVVSAQSSPATPSTKSDARQETGAQPAGEHQFVQQVAIANMAEIQLGHLAVKKAEDAEVRNFAQMMIDAHLKAQKELADAASGFSIRWPTQLDQKHRQLHQRLSALGSKQFDREYMKAMVDGHRDVEKMLAARADDHTTKASGNTERPQSRPAAAATSNDSALTANVNRWAADTLPAVRAHLKHAEQIYGQAE